MFMQFVETINDPEAIARPIPELLEEIRQDLGLPPTTVGCNPLWDCTTRNTQHPEDQQLRTADNPERSPPPQQSACDTGQAEASASQTSPANHEPTPEDQGPPYRTGS